MTQIEDLQGRISRALDKIASGVDQLAVSGGDGTAELEEQLARAQAEAGESRDALELVKSETEQAVELAREQAAEQARLAVEAEIEQRIQAAVADAETERMAALRAAATANAALEELKAQMDTGADAQEPPVSAGAAPALKTDNDPFSPDPGIVGAAAAVATSQAAADDGAVTALREALEDEKMANAQLEERHRVLALRVKELEGGSDTAPKEVEKSPDIKALDAELYKLRKCVAELEDSNRALREANAQGVGDPHLINKAMLSELESLRATRASEVAEGRALLAALEPLLDHDAEPAEEAG